MFSQRLCLSASALLIQADLGAAYHAPIQDGASLEQEDEADTLGSEFAAYTQRFGRNYAHGSKEYFMRRSLFEQRRKAVNKHNAKAGRFWQATTGLFADYTEAERSAMKGYVKHMRSSGAAALSAKASSLMRYTQSAESAPASFDWLNLTVAKQIPDQGQCGSCWAVTAKSVLDAHHEIARGHVRQFAAQQIVSCVQNPRACGGTGGCDGATVELAFDWVVHNGCAEENAVPYKAQNLNADSAKCADSKLLSMPTTNALYSDSQLAGNAFGMYGYEVLEHNKEEPMIMALYHHGPVAASVAADNFFEYDHGIMDDCDKNAIVDHAVTMYGYGEGEGGFHKDSMFPVLEDLLKPGPYHSRQLTKTGVKKYWLIRNSWGKGWGEDGFLRIERFGEEGKHCGIDTDNSKGIGCKGDPQEVPVCGMCGILFDSVVPHFHKATQGSSLTQQAEMEVDTSGRVIRRN